MSGEFNSNESNQNQSATNEGSHNPLVQNAVNQNENELLSQGLFHSSIFEKLTKAEIEDIKPLCRLHNFNEGDVIINQSERSNAFYVVIEGFVVVSKMRHEKEVFITTLGPADHFGEAALFRDSERIATVKAQTEGSALVIQSAEFRDFLTKYPVAANKILFRMLQNIFERLEITNEELGIHRIDGLGQDAIDKLFT